MTGVQTCALPISALRLSSPAIDSPSRTRTTYDTIVTARSASPRPSRVIPTASDYSTTTTTDKATARTTRSYVQRQYEGHKWHARTNLQ